MTSNNDYKLDFSYKFNGKKFNLKDCDKYNYWYSETTLLNTISGQYKSPERHFDLWSRLVNSDFVEVNPAIEQLVRMYIDNGGIEASRLKGLAIDYSAERVYLNMHLEMVKRTSEYAEAETSFQNWLKSRPGIIRSWQQHVEKANARGSGYQQYPTELTLSVLSSNTGNGSFRRILEHNRPDRFVAGEVVKLKFQYINKRGRDPFYYKYDPEIKKADRVGTVLKKESADTNYNYGVGSREIRVLWFATGEETCAPEQSLSLLHV
jgi:hypothetical protein